MVFDNLKNCQLYYGMHPRFREAFDFIKKAIAENLPVGKYEIDGKSLWASVQEYTSKLYEDAKAEAHKNYIDIQFIVSGKEKMEVMNISEATAKTEYNEERDFSFFENADGVTGVVCGSGEYGIFFPWDIHKPGLVADEENREVKKIVVKVKMD